MKIPVHLAMSVVSATLFDADGAPMLLNISTDTRTLAPGDTFIALRGDRFNGHDYVAQAVAAGAAMVIIDEPSVRVAGTATMMVERTKTAYMALAGLARELFKGRVIAITGSTGKTTTKVFLAQLLAARYGSRVAVPPANENNEIGVSKLLLGASNEEHDVIVVEMGARQTGDIAALVAIAKPEIGILTNVGDAHVEIMGSREELARTKWALFARGARAVLNADDAVSVERAPSLPGEPHWFAARGEDGAVPAHARVTALIGRSRLIDVRDGATHEYLVEVGVPGAHNCANLAAAIAGALELDITPEACASVVPKLQLPPGRFESFTAAGGWRIIYDAYNANAAGTMAALDAFALEKPQRAIAVLGSMAELGDESVALHERVGAHAAQRVQLLLVAGDYAEALERGAVEGGLAANAIVRIESNAAAATWLREHARQGDAVLLKASRKYKFEEIVQELLA